METATGGKTKPWVRAIVILCLFCSVGGRPSRAGMDDHRLVSRVKGVVSVRGHIRREGRRIDAKQWVRARAGDVLEPGTDVRTGAASFAALQLGDGTPLPTGSIRYWNVLHPDTMVRIHRPYMRRKIMEVRRGRMTDKSDRR